MFVLGRRAGWAPSANSEHLRKRLAGKNRVVTQMGKARKFKAGAEAPTLTHSGMEKIAVKC